MRTGGKIQLNKITINKCCLMETMRYRATQSVRRPFQSASRLYRTKLDLDLDLDNGVSIHAIVVFLFVFGVGELEAVDSRTCSEEKNMLSAVKLQTCL